MRGPPARELGAWQGRQAEDKKPPAGSQGADKQQPATAPQAAQTGEPVRGTTAGHAHPAKAGHGAAQPQHGGVLPHVPTLEPLPRPKGELFWELSKSGLGAWPLRSGTAPARRVSALQRWSSLGERAGFTPYQHMLLAWQWPVWRTGPPSGADTPFDHALDPAGRGRRIVHGHSCQGLDMLPRRTAQRALLGGCARHPDWPASAAHGARLPSAEGLAGGRCSRRHHGRTEAGGPALTTSDSSRSCFGAEAPSWGMGWGAASKSSERLRGFAQRRKPVRARPRRPYRRPESSRTPSSMAHGMQQESERVRSVSIPPPTPSCAR